ncbi:hypothetical protein [Labilibaculum sp.]|uniref:hypothetical protein n=1 Tax=Labilibaculum sp. TaxID=2060723 RepID=UPI003566B611
MAEVSYKIIQTEKNTIVLREFFGDVEVTDIRESFIHIFKEYVEQEIVGIITDFTQANMLINISEFPKVLEFIRQNNKLFQLKLAVIVNTPEKTILPMLAHARLKDLHVKPFATMQASINWMNED